MTVRSVVQALRIVRHMIDAAQPLGVTAIARQLGLSPSSCFNLLRTLVAEEFLRFDATAKTYSLGPALMRMAQRAQSVDSALALARPQLEAFAARYGVASGLWRLSASQRLVLVAVADSDNATRIHMTVGQRLPMLIGAIGRCVAAHADLPDDVLASGFTALRWQNAPTFARYKREVAQARKSGWSVDDGDYMRGVTTIAAPVLDADGAVAFCLANTLFRGQHGERVVTQMCKETAAVARALSDRLFGAAATPAP
jgi:DNA-binding IclR family transcriptional regulator